MFNENDELRITEEELINKIYSTMTTNDIELIYGQYGNESSFKAKLTYMPYTTLVYCLDGISKAKLLTCPGIHERLFSIVDEYAEYTSDNILLGKYLMRKADYYETINTNLAIELYLRSLKCWEAVNEPGYCYFDNIYKRLAIIYLKLNRHDDTIEICKKAIVENRTGYDWKNCLERTLKKINPNNWQDDYDELIQYLNTDALNYKNNLKSDRIKANAPEQKVSTYKIIDSTTVGFDICAFQQELPKTRHKGNSLLSLESNYTVIDIETTGFDPNFDEIIELSAIRVENDQIVGEFTTLVKPENEISSFITDLTGITAEMLESAPKIESAIKDYIGFIGKSILLGHNVNFDINFIYDGYYRCFTEIFNNDFIDTMRLSKKVLPELYRHRLKDLVDHYNIKTEGAHRGILDCHATYKVYNALKEHIAVNNIDLTAKTAKKHSSAFNAKKIAATVDSFEEEHPLYEKYIVFTGELEKMDRRYAAQIVANFGGINENGITKKTNYLILGNNDFCKSIRGGKSSKQKKAEEYVLKGQDLQIISETEFYHMISGHG